MKILITGATGFIGTTLVSELLSAGHDVVVLTRDQDKARAILGDKVACYTWADTNVEPTKFAFAGVSAIVNLMGEGIAAKRWTDDQKKKIFDSRVVGTKNLLKAAEKYLDTTLSVLISGSATGFYGAGGDQAFTEDSENGTDFLAGVCAAWEKEAQQFKRTRRTVILRIGVVLGDHGGALSKMLPLFKFFWGGRIGSGKQWMSWIHRDDLVRLILAALNTERVFGVINAVAPHAVTNSEFTKTLARVLKRPAIIPAPAFALKAMMGELSCIVLDSQKVSAGKLNRGGFEFRYPDLKAALEEVCHGKNSPTGNQPEIAA